MFLAAVRRWAAPVSHRLRLQSRPALEWLPDRTTPAVIAPLPSMIVDSSAVSVSALATPVVSVGATEAAADLQGVWWGVDVRSDAATGLSPVVALAGASAALAGVWSSPPIRLSGLGRT